MSPSENVSCRCLAPILIFGLSPAHAGMWDDPKNLTILPEDISPDELHMTMRGLAMGTGSRYSEWHVDKLDYYPQSSRSYSHRGQVYAEPGD
jgi:hypothetical protein